MAHTNQQRKRIRQDAKLKASNTQAKSAIKTTVKKAEGTIKEGDKATIASVFKTAMSALARGAQKGFISKGAAKRKTSRLAARIAKQK
jgi:small subunit ribosomal protein S20